MAEDDDKESKTESPSEKKLNDAMEKGNVPFSREVTMFASVFASYIFVVFFLPGGFANFAEALKDIFEQPEAWRLENATDVTALILFLFNRAAGLVVPIILLLVSFGIASSVLQNFPRMVLDRIAPKPERLSPMAGLKRIYGKPGLVEFGKGFFKIAIISTIIAVTLKDDFYGSLDAMFSDPVTIFSRMSGDLNQIMVVVLLCSGVIAIADFFWTRHHWLSELKMTKEEVKEEFKQSQGDPIVRARLRSIARDRARRRMITAVPRATLVVANPTHYAVALRYVREEGDAPVVIAKGQDLVALKIREIAEENGIPVFEDPPLARSMFAQVSVDSVIPPVFYKAVAELIHRVYAANQKRTR
ncbi:flagellar biosynthesis protein FlhB [Xaviernesmea oryzae]|uniref:Flagellar biosynthetic protein FlhB n=1 Tax=Xaviernesmea oryzae TaxID=464029 RepID=A0A1Q9ARZ7_9HYPH|nr:flagellar biosynthesis protein FlhB [Xaviernesmea oryzae]OLP58197.1 flagellar biosynthesis protein FlhB [Xaviernesmea oryzae]SEL46960.1 flagellar biosynthetic protein FlhB [Xaviernesmea oryzae]